MHKVNICDLLVIICYFSGLVLPQACLILSGARVKGVILECRCDNKILKSIMSKILAPTCHFNELKRCVRDVGSGDVAYQKLLMSMVLETLAMETKMGLLMHGQFNSNPSRNIRSKLLKENKVKKTLEL